MTACGDDAEYSILLLDEDQTTVLYAAKVEAGDAIVGAPTPTKEADEEYTYSFSCWVDANGNKVVLSFATKDITAYASYTQTLREYSLTINVNDAATYSYDKVSVSLDGVQLTTGATVHYGDLLEISVNGSDGFDIVDQSFVGLSKITQNGETYYKVTGNVVISYTDEASDCTVTVLSYDKSTSIGTITTTYGSSIASQLTTPSRTSTTRASYTFDCWKNLSTDEAVNITKITSSMTIYASFIENLIPYTLTISNTAKVSVFNGTEEVLNGDPIYYGDTLTVVTSTTTGYHITSLTATGELDGDVGEEVDIYTEENYAFKVVGNMTIGYSETINTYTVKLVVDGVEKDYVVEYSTDMTTDGAYSSILFPEKEDDETYSYEFDYWKNKSGGVADLTYITSNVTAYAVFTSEYIEYDVSLSDRVSVTMTSGEYEGTVYTSASENPTMHYGDTFIATYDLADGFSLNTFSLNGTDITSGQEITMQQTNTVEINFAMQKTFVAEKYSNAKAFKYFTGTSTILPSACVDGGNTYSYTYIGTQAVSYTATYDTFLQMSQVKNVSTSYTPNFTASSETLKTVANLAASSYITTPLYKGMTIEFTISANVTALIFGLSTYEDITTNAESLNWWGAESGNSNYLWYCPTFNFYAAESTTSESKPLRRIISGSEVDETKETAEYKGSRLQIGTSSLDNLEDSVTIRLVLNDDLELYINGVKETLDFSRLSAYTITSYTLDEDASTPYYFSFAASSEATVQITEFGYIDNSEWGYLQYLSDKTITFLGDSITAGFYASDFTRGEEYEGTLRYTTQLSTALGMTEDNLGVAGTTYVTGTSNDSRISDAESITTSSEIVVVFLGINDFYSRDSDGNAIVELGEFGTYDTSTLYGATYVMYSALAQTFAGEEDRVYICTPVPSLTDLSQTVTNSKGYTLQDYCDVITEVATYFGFNVVDLYNNAGMTASDFVGTTDTENHSGDVLHPNDSGHAKIASYLYESIIEVGRWTYL